MTIQAQEIVLQRAAMSKAIACALAGLKKGGGPFGACISTLEGKIVACAANTVLPDGNPTRHAEVNAIAAACKKLKTHVLDGHVLYTTTEPCLMCRGAIYWAQIPVIVYGTGQKDARGLGFDEINITDAQMRKIARRKPVIITGFMREACREIFRQFRRMQGKLY